MATPTFVSVSPARIHTAGQLVTITGTNFRLPSTPASSNGPLPEPINTVQVLVNGQSCTNVRVYSATRITCDCPSLDAAVYGITIKNLDNAGAPIGGETVTAPSAITYARPDLASNGDYKRIVEALIVLFRRQLIENTVVSVSVDFAGPDERSADVKFVQPTHLPALALGLQTVRDRKYAQDIRLMTPVDSTSFRRWRPFLARNLEVTLTYMDNHQGRLLNAQQALDAILVKTKYLTVDRGDGTFVNYEFEQQGEVTDLSTPNLGDVKAFQTKVVVYGIETQQMPGFTDFLLTEIGGVVDTLTVGSQKLLP